MGLGLFCMSEHIKSLRGQYGARRRSDGREGTEIWFSFPLIVPEAGQQTLQQRRLTNSHTKLSILSLYGTDMDHFVMNDVGHGIHGPNTHHNRNVMKPTEVVSMGDDVNNTTVLLTTAIDDKHSFSSPQNRRSPSQRSHHSLLNMSMRSAGSRISARGSTAPLGGARDTSTYSDTAVVDAGDISSYSLRATGPSARDSRTNLLVGRRSGDRTRTKKSIQEMVGALPILLVDDSVSILKMTKRAIQNECDNVRYINHILTHY